MKKYKKIDYNSKDLEKFSISELKKIADYSIRQFLLNTTENKSGNYKCPIKNNWYSVSKMNVSHFIDRGILSLRYDLRNCHLVSEQSNQWDAQVPCEGYKSLHHRDYELYLGEETVEKLKEESKQIKILNRSDYIELIQKFRDE